MPNRQAGQGPSTPFWSTYQLAFLAILAFALVAVTAGLVFDLIDATPPDEETSAPASSEDGEEQEGSGSARTLGTLPSELDEASGIAVNAESAVIWAHNDDPGPVTLFALDMEGRLLGTYPVPGVRLSDLEDIARAPCPGEDRDLSCLYLGDTGDNDRSRTASRIVALAEPSTPDEEVHVVASVIYTYEDGRGRDVESLAVSGERLLLVSKGQEGQADVFELGLETFAPFADGSPPDSAGSVAVARHVATLSIDVSDETNRPTGAAMSPGGEWLAVRTARTVYRFSLDDLEATPVECPIGADEPQGEAIDFLDEDRVLLTGESGADPNPAPLLELRCASSAESGQEADGSRADLEPET